MKKNKIILTTAVCLLPLVAGLLLWNRLPEQMPVHFNFAGEVDGYGSRAFTVIGMPLMLVILHLLVVFGVSNDPKKENIGNRLIGLVLWIIPVVSCVTGGFIIGISLGYHSLDSVMIVHLLCGILFLMMGNYMTKNHQNYTVGIRCPWTLNSKENWNRTHRLASRLWMTGGLVLIINGFLKSSPVMILVLLVCGVAPLVYSYTLYRKGI